ncbi:MAG: single-stranded-DNA-specific exonuclease RecJ [Elusimicrobiota bacterium]|jgi:single-stranded-DNA-specific exonuclease|nr:single-stranded-DNA-specific exonuclease RecJ [Elusimicrobiota bacterium]
MDKNWKIAKENTEKCAEFEQILSLNRKIASILINRGIDTVEKAKYFIYGKVFDMHNPFLFSDMLKAVERIRKAIDCNESILVYGDRDVDGVTSVTIMVNTIKTLGGNVRWYVPANEGYGVHKDIVSKYVSENVKLLITVDCGISAIEEIGYAKKLGVDVIITDHHEPHYDGVPPADIIINPKVAVSNYPFKNIAGCLVALKTAQALTFSFSKEYNKKILICFSSTKDNCSCGSYVCFQNNIEVERTEFKSALELKQVAKRAFSIFTNNSNLSGFLIRDNVLLKSKINLMESNEINSIDDIVSGYKIKSFQDNDKMQDFLENTLDLCALGTIADSMPLVDENRIVVNEGLKILAKRLPTKPSLNILINENLKDVQRINIKTISWNVTPIINSSGRMGRGSLSAQFLLAKDSFQAKTLYDEIIKLNNERRILQNANFEEFKQLLKEQCDVENDKALVVKAKNLEHGVTGIVASYMAKEYVKPVFLIISDGEEATGTARAPEGFDIIAAFESVKDILLKYGGHSQAAGFTVKDADIKELTTRILEYVDGNFNEAASSNTLFIDAELKVSDINLELYKQIKMMEPFGNGNLPPIFCMKDVSPTQFASFGQRNEHLKFKISQKGSKNIQAVFWNKASLSEVISTEKFIDIAFMVEMNEKFDGKTAKLHIVDVKANF